MSLEGTHLPFKQNLPDFARLKSERAIDSLEIQLCLQWYFSGLDGFSIEILLDEV